MELVTGQEVWIAFATGFSSVTGQAVAQVGHGVVIDGENRVVKRDSGYVSVLGRSSVEQPHPSEAAAWEANAAKAAVNEIRDTCEARYQALVKATNKKPWWKIGG